MIVQSKPTPRLSTPVSRLSSQQSIAQWLCHVVGESSWRVKTQQRGNVLHVLWEDAVCPPQAAVLVPLIHTLAAEDINRWHSEGQPPIYALRVYGRVKGQKPAWDQTIYLHQIERYLIWAESLGEPDLHASPVSAHPVASAIQLSTFSQAQKGEPEAIAHYLSESLTSLGVGIRVAVKPLEPEEVDVELGASQRLWVLCEASYGLDAAFLSERLARPLRQLQLQGFRDAAIFGQVSGEARPDWVLRVDLTPQENWLRQWGRWGDGEAIALLLERSLEPLGITAVCTLQAKTLQVSCRPLPQAGLRAELVPQAAIVKAIARVLDDLAPQGIHACTIQGPQPSALSRPTPSQTPPPTPSQTTTGQPPWLEWLRLPAADHRDLHPATLDLAEQGNLAALGVLLNRLLNPNLQTQLATGGVRVQVLRKGDLLHVMCDASLPPSQDAIAKAVYRYVRQRRLPRIAGVRVYGRKAGQRTPQWRYGRDFVPRHGTTEGRERGAAPVRMQEWNGIGAASGPTSGELVPKFALSIPMGEMALEATPELLEQSQQLSLWSGRAGALAEAPSGAGAQMATRPAAGTAIPLRSRRPNREPSWLAQAIQGLGQGLLQTGLVAPVTASGVGLTGARLGGARAGAGLGRRWSQTATVAAIWASLGLLVLGMGDVMLGQWLRRLEVTLPGARSGARSPSPLGGDIALAETAQDLSGTVLNPNPNRFTRPGLPQAGLPQAGLPQAGLPQAGLPQAGLPQAGGGRPVPPLSPQVLNYPSFNNPLLDQKLALYRQRVLEEGAPDVLILGSSRALRGIDPTVLRTTLARVGYPNLKIFNFSINGSTAQVVKLQLQLLLSGPQVPRLIIWADGARAFNSGSDDRTYQLIAQSTGYQELLAGELPALTGNGFAKLAGQATQTMLQTLPGSPLVAEAVSAFSYPKLDRGLSDRLGMVSSVYGQRDRLKAVLNHLATQGVGGLGQRSILDRQATVDGTTLVPDAPEGEGTIDFDGFMALSMRFNPATYYQRYARVAGRYDGDYQDFRLAGEQLDALEGVYQLVQERQIPLVFVSLPLTADYLDEDRLSHEQTFQRFMFQQMGDRRLIFRDLAKEWPNRVENFSDPSHLNRYGAQQVSVRLADDPLIPWPVAQP